MTHPKLSPAQKLAINYYRAKLNLLNVVSPRLAANEALDLFTKPYGSPKHRTGKLFTDAESLKLVSGGHMLNGYKWRSHPNNDRKLLILHGFGGSVASFERYINPSLRMGYDVYAYDAPGHGMSSGKRLNVPIYTEMIADIVQAHGPFHAFIAHSLGGLALMLSLSEMELLYRPRVVLIAPATESTTAVDKFFSFLQLPDSLRINFEQRIERLGGVPLQWYSISRVLRNTPAEILWLHDENDSTTPIEDVYPLWQQNPEHVHFHFTKGLGHSNIYKDNKVKRMITDYLIIDPEKDTDKSITAS